MNFTRKFNNFSNTRKFNNFSVAYCGSFDQIFNTFPLFSFFILALNGCNSEKSTPVFTAVENENQKGFVWLKLEDKYLEQWEAFCLRKHVQNEGCSFLSSKLFISYLKNVITEPSEIHHFVSRQFSSKFEDVCVTGVYKGPALNIEVKIVKQGGVCSSDEWQILFDADFTLALHCCFWPEVAKGLLS